MEEEEELASLPRTDDNGPISEADGPADISSASAEDGLPPPPSGCAQLVGEILITGSSIVIRRDDNDEDHKAVAEAPAPAVIATSGCETGGTRDLCCESQAEEDGRSPPEAALLDAEHPAFADQVGRGKEDEDDETGKEVSEIVDRREKAVVTQVTSSGGRRPAVQIELATAANTGGGRPERHVHIRESIEIHEASDSSRYTSSGAG
jgi:hypothetical protein